MAEEEKRQLDEWLKDDRNKKIFFLRLVNKQRILVKMERLDEYDWEKSWKVMEKSCMKGKSSRGNIGVWLRHC